MGCVEKKKKMKDIPLFLEALSLVFVAAVSVYLYFRLRKEGFSGSVPALMGAGSVFYSIQALLGILWVSGALAHAPSDFLLTKAIFGIVQAVIILFLVYSITENKAMLYLLLLFIASSIPLRFNLVFFFALITITSYILIFIVLGDMLITHRGRGNSALRAAGLIGALYALSSILSFTLYFVFGIGLAAFMFFLQNVAIAASMFFLASGYSHINSKSSRAKAAKASTQVFLPFLFLRYSVFVVGMCGFVFFSTVSIHELGHTLAAQLYGCNAKTVIYGNAENPHTEFECSKKYSIELITVAGVLIPIFVAIAFMFTKEALIVRMAYMIMGFNLFISYRDLKELYLSDSAILIIISLSVITIVFSIIRLSVYYLYQQAASYFFSSTTHENAGK